jgi:hypothetical protein
VVERLPSKHEALVQTTKRRKEGGRERGWEGRKEGRKEDQALGTTVYGDSIRKRTRSCQVTGSRVTEKK